MNKNINAVMIIK